MGFSVADLFRASLLILNALAILSERRFLAPMGLVPGGSNPSPTTGGQQYFGDDPFGGSSGGAANGEGIKQQIGHLLMSVRMLLRWPLIILNVVTIAFALIFG